MPESPKLPGTYMIRMLRFVVKLQMSNGSYKLSADVRCRDISFEVSDFVMARIRPERLPTRTPKTVHARATGPYQILRKLGTNAYVLNLLENLGISLIFNVEDLTLHRGTFEPPRLPFSDAVGTQVPKLPPFPQSHTMFDDELVSPSCGGFRRFLVQWLGRPHADAT